MTAIAIGLLACASIGAADDDVNLLVGDWIALSMQSGLNGKPTTRDNPGFRTRLTITPNSWLLRADQGTPIRSQGQPFKIDPARTPREIDILSQFTQKPQQIGVYELDGDRLKVGLTAPSFARPGAVGPAKDTVYWVFVRDDRKAANNPAVAAQLDPLLKILDDPDRSFESRRDAVRKIGALGPDAAGAISKLQAMAISGPGQAGLRQESTAALSQIGAPAVPALVEIATRAELDVGNVAINAMGQLPLSQVAQGAAPGLLKLFGSPPRNIPVHQIAARQTQLINTLVAVKAPPDEFVPILQRILQDPLVVKGRKPPHPVEQNWGRVAMASLIALENLGPDARAALPTLTHLLDPKVWRDIQYPQGMANKILGVLGAIGPDAAPALPAIRAFRDATGQYHAREAEQAILRIKGEASP